MVMVESVDRLGVKMRNEVQPNFLNDLPKKIPSGWHSDGIPGPIKNQVIPIEQERFIIHGE